MHNTLFRSTGLPHHYDRRETKDVEEIRDLIRVPTFGGASVTIPLKLDIIPCLDHVDIAAKAIGAVNTIVSSTTSEKVTLTGYNTDYLGIQLALQRAGAEASDSAHKQSAMVIGGGGTARAALYALHEMGYSPLYLIGRNKEKLQSLISAFDNDYNIRILSTVDDVTALSSTSDSSSTTNSTLPDLPNVAVGTIPGDVPIAPDMREVLCHIFEANDPSTTTTVGQLAGSGSKKRVLLEMAYKPAVTALMQLAKNSGWETVPGLEALVGQGVHQVSLHHHLIQCLAVQSGLY